MPQNIILRCRAHHGLAQCPWPFGQQHLAVPCCWETLNPPATSAPAYSAKWYFRGQRGSSWMWCSAYTRLVCWVRLWPRVASLLASQLLCLPAQHTLLPWPSPAHTNATSRVHVEICSPSLSPHAFPQNMGLFWWELSPIGTSLLVLAVKRREGSG